MGFLDIALMVALVAITGVLLFGVFSMARGGEASRRYSNKMMRWRIALQLVAVLILVMIMASRNG